MSATLDNNLHLGHFAPFGLKAVSHAAHAPIEGSNP
jgi:hypothetical protein